MAVNNSPPDGPPQGPQQSTRAKAGMLTVHPGAGIWRSRPHKPLYIRRPDGWVSSLSSRGVWKVWSCTRVDQRLGCGPSDARRASRVEGPVAIRFDGEQVW